MAKRSSWKETDVTYAIRDLLDRCGLDYQVVNDERLPRDPAGRMRWVLVDIADQLIAIDPEVVETPAQFNAFMARAERFLTSESKDENMFHPTQYWGVGMGEKSSRKTTRQECEILSPRAMIKRVEDYASKQRPARSSSKIEAHITKRVENALRIMRWKLIQSDTNDLVGEDADGRKVLIEIKENVKVRDIANYGRQARALPKFPHFDEFWIVGGEIAPSALLREEVGDVLQAFTIDELEQRANKDEWDKYHRQIQTPPKARGKPKLKTKIGKAVVANEEQLEVLLSSFQLLLEEKLAALALERPNSDAAQKLRNDEVSRYEGLKRNVEAMREAVEKFTKKPEAEEKALEKRAKTLAEGVQQWWDKDSDKICARTYNAGLFMLACGVLGLAGTAVAVTGAAGIVFGRKPLGDVFQKFKGKLKKR